MLGEGKYVNEDDGVEDDDAGGGQMSIKMARTLRMKMKRDM